MTKLNHVKTFNYHIQASRSKHQPGTANKSDAGVDNYRAEGDWFSTYGDDKNKGGPFSALTPSMWPARGIHEPEGNEDRQNACNDEEDDVQHDEFGFRFFFPGLLKKCSLSILYENFTFSIICLKTEILNNSSS